MTKHQPNFGPDDPSEITYSRIAEQVRDMRPAELTPDRLPDVIIILDYMQGVCVEMHDANVARTQALDEREAELTRREKELELRQRAVDAVLRADQAKKARSDKQRRFLFRRAG